MPQRNPIVLFGGANIGSLFFEERHRVIARIDDLEFGVVALLAMFANHLFERTGGGGWRRK